MSSFAIALTDAIRVALKADAGVTALVAAKVFDQVPGDARGESGAINAAAPWIYVGPIQGTRFDNDCTRMWSPTIRLFCASTAFGRREAWEIADAVDRALEGMTLALADGFAMCSELRASNSGDVIAPTTPKTVFLDFTCTIARSDGDDGD